jgi:hypothetical protein
MRQSLERLRTGTQCTSFVHEYWKQRSDDEFGHRVGSSILGLDFNAKAGYTLVKLDKRGIKWQAVLIK